MNFYWGSYTLKDNSNYTAGTISLTYMSGITLTATGNDVTTAKATINGIAYDLNDLMLITFGKSGEDEEGNATGLKKANNADNPETAYKTGKEFFDAHIDSFNAREYYTVEGLTSGDNAIDEDTAEKQAELRGDIETFTFSLSDGSLLDGYCALNMHEWFWEDQIRFTNSKEDGTGTWSVANTYTLGNNGIATGQSGGRDVSFFQPNLKKTQRGSAKNKYTSDGSKIMYKGSEVEYKAGETPTWSKSYFSTGRCSWDVSDRAFARIVSKTDINSALDFIEGKISSKKKAYIDFVKNDILDDAYEAEDTDYDDYNARSAAAEEAVYASESLIDFVGEYVEK